MAEIEIKYLSHIVDSSGSQTALRLSQGIRGYITVIVTLKVVTS